MTAEYQARFEANLREQAAGGQGTSDTYLCVPNGMPRMMSADEPIAAPPFRKVTVPVGVPVPDEGTTFAVNVTFCPRTDGFGADVSVAVVAIRLFIVCVKTEDVLALSLASPL